LTQRSVIIPVLLVVSRDPGSQPFCT
jgi:hypothetical protein